MAKKKPDNKATDQASRVKVVDLATFTPDPRNTRVHGERNREIIGASFKEFGAARSIVVDGKGIVRAGNGTLEAAKAAGLSQAIVIDADGDQLVVVRRKDWTNTQAVGYGILDNRATDTSTNDDDALTSTLKALQDDGFDMDAVGYNAAELDALIGSLGADMANGGVPVDDPAGEWQGMPEFEHEDQTSQFKAIVHFANEADMRAFEELVGQTIPTNTRAIWHPKAERQTVKGSGYVSDES